MLVAFSNKKMFTPNYLSVTEIMIIFYQKKLTKVDWELIFNQKHLLILEH